MPSKSNQQNNPFAPSDIAGLAVYTVIILLTIAFSFSVGIASNEVVAIWPAAGLGVWAVLQYGWRAIPAIFLAHYGYSALFQDGSHTIYLLANLGNAIGCYLPVVLYRKLGGTDTPFHSVNSVILFIGIVGLGMGTISATVGVGALAFVGGLSTELLPPIFGRWVFSDLSGILFVTPLLAALLPAPGESVQSSLSQLKTEGALPLAGSAAMIAVLFAASMMLPAGYSQYPVILLVMPLGMWLALRGGRRASLLFLSVTTIAALTITLMQVSSVTESTFLTVQLYGVVVISANVVLHAAGQERNQLVDALDRERLQLEQAIEHRTSALREQAQTDELTGLANRRLFEDQLDAIFSVEPTLRDDVFLLYMDLDQFKIVNDTSGHAAGDDLLREVSRILTTHARSGDLVSRLGGDEFAILTAPCSKDQALEVAEAVRVDIAEIRFRWGAETYRIGVSIGIACVDGKVHSAEDAKQLADAACYEAKNNGRNRIEIAENDDRIVEDQRGQVRWAQRLTDAMEHDRFTLYTQTIKQTDPNDTGPEHVEVLVRLRDIEQKRLVPPGAFMPAAERYGLATKLDEWVVRSLLRTLYVHQAFDAKARQYWVNLSGNSVGNDQFVNFLIESMENSPIEPGLINFEITETAVIHNMKEAGRLMGVLHDMGCKFALDDFGTGVSSFSHLKKLPVDYLKIDGMFVNDLANDRTDQIFVKSIIDIAHAMGLKAVVEHVEDANVERIVTEMGADLLQGYSISKPQLLTPELNVNDMLKRLA
ncbi:MAG: EAL domain-containing protein [Pseudomonadota bacterium]